MQTFTVKQKLLTTKAVNKEKINNAEHGNPVINIIEGIGGKIFGNKIIMKALKY